MGNTAVDDSEIQSDERFADAIRLIVALRAEGSKTSAIASRLNMDGYVTRKGMPWTQFTVNNAINAVRKVAEPIKLAPKAVPSPVAAEAAPRSYSLEEAACLMASAVLADEAMACGERARLAGAMLARAVGR